VTGPARVLAQRDLGLPGLDGREIELAHASGERTSAYLLRPTAPGPHPAVLYSHWLEHAPDDNKTQFLDEACELAAAGTVCLLVDTVFADWPESRLVWTGHDSAVDRGIVTQQLRELGGALCLLRQLPEVDAGRIALVGHDFGAMFNILLAAEEPDLVALVVMAAVPTFAEWFLLGSKLDEEAREEYAADLADLAPATWLGRCEAPVLFQFGEKDLWFVPRDRAERLAAAARRSTVTWHDSNHAIHHLAGPRAERLDWLRRHLQFAPSPAPVDGATVEA